MTDPIHDKGLDLFIKLQDQLMFERLSHAERDIIDSELAKVKRKYMKAKGMK